MAQPSPSMGAWPHSAVQQNKKEETSRVIIWKRSETLFTLSEGARPWTLGVLPDSSPLFCVRLSFSSSPPRPGQRRRDDPGWGPVTAKCLDVVVASKADGANVQQWSCHGGSNQKWELVKTNQPYFFIKSVNSGKCLDVIVASKTDGANVQQWSCHGGPNQKWVFLDGVQLSNDVHVPNVAYKTLAQAQAALTAVGLGASSQITYQQIFSNQGDTSRNGQVAAQNPAAGSTTAPGTVVALKLFRVMVMLPNVMGQTLNQADAAFAAAKVSENGVKVTVIHPEVFNRPDLHDKVLTQTPAGSSNPILYVNSVAITAGRNVNRVPHYHSKTLAQLKAEITSGGMSYTVHQLGFYSPYAPRSSVSSTNPKGGSIVAPGTVVKMWEPLKTA